MHNIVRKHRRTVSSVNVGDQAHEQKQKSTMSTFQDTYEMIQTQIPKPQLICPKEKLKIRHRAVSDLIQQSNKIHNSKSVLIQELNLSINYKDPVFEFGKQKRLQQLQQRKHLFKKSAIRQLQSIAQKSQPPKSSRLILRKKIVQPQSQIKPNQIIKKSTVPNSLSKPTSSKFRLKIEQPTKHGQKLTIQKRDILSLKKQLKKPIQTKKGFKF